MGLFNRFPSSDEYQRGRRDGATETLITQADAILAGLDATDLPDDHPVRRMLLGMVRSCKETAAEIGGTVVR